MTDDSNKELAQEIFSAGVRRITQQTKRIAALEAENARLLTELNKMRAKEAALFKMWMDSD